MPNIRDILERGYFPRELPPPFKTDKFAAWIDNNLGNLPVNFTSKKPKKAACGIHSLARGGDEPRFLGIVNPIPYQRLVRLMVDRWQRISKLTNNTTLSTSIPKDLPAPSRAVAPLRGLGDLLRLRTEARFRGKYLLRADINKFYPSIYSHVISWAIEGRNRARNGSKKIFGNFMDQLVTSCQDRQSIGIPIGPDTSLILAELVLCPIDRQLRKRFRKVFGFRHVDDYELIFETRSEAEDCMALLRTLLRDHRLALNLKKTYITELPAPYSNPWVKQLRQWNFSSNKYQQSGDLSDYFDLAFSLSKEFPLDQVLKYAVSRIRGIKVDPKNLSLLQSYLFQVAISEAGALPFILERLIMIQQSSGYLSVKTLEDVLNQVIIRSVRLRLDSEAAWALWILLAFNLPVSSRAAIALNESNDSITLLLALWLRAKGLMHNKFQVSRLVELMTNSGLWSEHWLLVYEANIKKWLKNRIGGDIVMADAHFSRLKSAGISFLDLTTTNLTLPYSVNRVPLTFGPLSLP